MKIRLQTGLVYAALLVGILTAVVGCASPSRSRTTGLTVLSKPVSVALVYVVISTTLPDLEPEKQRLSDAVLSELNQAKMFDTIVQNRPEAGLANGIKIAVEIQSLKKVTAEARVWTGALAGRARITVRTTVTDLKSGRQLLAFVVVGESGKSAFAGTTDEAIGRAAEQVVNEVLKLTAQATE